MNKHEVFISYCTQDKCVADAVCAGLEAGKVRCWIAPRDVPPGSNWAGAISRAITDSKIMVVVFSSHTNQSRHVMNEIERAVSRGVAIIPFRIEAVAPSEDLELFISSCHWLDALTPPLEAKIGELLHAAKAMLHISVEGEDVTSSAAASPPPVFVPLPPSPIPSDPARRTAEPLATWSLVLGILSILTCAFGGILAGIPAVICGHIGRARIRRDPMRSGAGLALAGLIAGYLSVAAFPATFVTAKLFPGIVAAFSRANEVAMESQVNEGVSYIQGKGVTKDEKRGFEMIRKAADKGSPKAEAQLGSLYENGIATTQDEAQACAWYRKAAEKGNAFAQYNLGRMYEAGKGVPKDSAEAAKWYRSAADSGYAFAQNNLGYMYETGNGVEKDLTEAVKWYRKAANQGFAIAQLNLGVRYGSGEGIEKNDAEAFLWLQKSAEQGNPDAEFNLGVKYAEGVGVTKDPAQALNWYRKSAEQGNAEAQINLCLMYVNGAGTPKDEAQGFNWCKKAADQGNPVAQYTLGVLYSAGTGTAQSDTEAAKWYRKSADQGYGAAECNLGVIYSSGLGVEKDTVEAWKWTKKAAEHGFPAAQNNLGLLYANGIGVKKDTAEAAKWLRIAAEQGNTEAQTNLKRLEAGDFDAEQNRVMRIADVKARDGSQGTKTFRIAIDSRPDAAVDPQQVKIQVYFYEKDEAGKLQFTESKITSLWTSAPVNWADSEPEVLEVTYPFPRESPQGSKGSTAAPRRKFFGFIVGVYYKGKLQDTQADPADLVRQIPLPKSL